MPYVPVVLIVFYLSGVAGLVYQIVWVREFGLVFGNTIHSAALVTGVFMAGLGIGGFVAGRLADRAYRRDPLSSLRYYAWAEFAIAALGGVLLLLLPRLEAFSAAFSSYRVTAEGWHEITAASYLLRYAIALGLLAPATLTMGATLTLLVRFVVQTDVRRAGWLVGLLYGLNTAGAATGALLVDVLAIPNLGIARTQLLAVALNAIAGAGALALLRAVRGGLPARPHPPLPPARTTSSVHWVGIAIFLSGFAAMGMEMVWFRFLSSALGQFRIVFSLLLFVILIGLWLGAVVGGALSRRATRPASLYVGSQLAFALTVLTAFALFDVAPITAEIKRQVPPTLFAEVRLFLVPIAALVGLPAFFMGFAYPVANAVVQEDEHAVGSRAGELYLWNSLGAVSGSTVAGFALLPWLGMKGSIALLVVCAVAVIAPLWRAGARGGWVLATSGVAAALVAAGLAGWVATPPDYLILKSFRSREGMAQLLRYPHLLAASEGLTESIIVVDVPDTGKVLYTNGTSMSGTTYLAQRYMRAFSHVPLLHMERPRDVLVICFGVGTTASAATLHPSVRNVEIADISRHVLSHGKLFADTNRHVLRDPRVSVFVNDGRHHLRMRAPESFDLVTLEPPPLQFSGVVSLYTREFYELARSRLKTGGFITQWLPMPMISPEEARSLVRSFLEVFPDGIMLNGASADFILMGRKDAPMTFGPAELRRALARSARVRADLKSFDLATPVEFFGSFAGDAETLARAVADFPAITDDLPLLEYTRAYPVPEGLPADLMDVSHLATWCPSCLGPGGRPSVPGLDAYLRVMDQLYGSTAPEPVQALLAEREEAFGVQLDRRLLSDTLRRSPYLARIWRTAPAPTEPAAESTRVAHP